MEMRCCRKVLSISYKNHVTLEQLESSLPIEDLHLNEFWNDRSISLSAKIRLMRSLVTSILLYACESWTLTAEVQRKIKAMEMRCCRKILHIS